MNIKEMIDFVFGINLFINASLFIPQAWRLFKKKDTQGSSLLTFGGFNFIQMSGIANGYYDHDLALMLGYIASFITCGSVTLLTIYYRYCRKHPSALYTSMTHEGENLHLLFSIIQKLPYHVFWKDKAGRYLGCNEKQAESAGYTLEEMIGKTTRDFPWRDSYDIIRLEDLAVMQNDEIRSVEEDGIKSDGSRVTYLTTRSPLKNSSGEIIGTLGIAVDITAEKKNAKEKIKLSNLLAATIAHELRTPLASIGLIVSSLADCMPILLKHYQASSEGSLSESQINFLAHFPSRAQNTLYAANVFIEMMLLQVKEGDFIPSVQKVNFCDFLLNTIQQYPFQKGEKDLINNTVNTDIFLNLDTKLLSHVFFNLFKNALFAMNEAGKGQIFISTELSEEHVLVIFEDTGIGIKQDMLDSIFEPFTSNKHHGNGIGLAFCRKAMRAHGGDIEVQSKPGEFTRFILRFPKKTTKTSLKRKGYQIDCNERL